MAFSTGYTFTFATAICVVCSLSIASVSMGLKDRQEANQRRDKQKNILAALGLPEDGHVPAGEEIDGLWKDRVQFRPITPDGELVDSGKIDLDKDGDTDPDDMDLARVAVKGTDNKPELLGVYVRKDGANDAAFAVPVNGKGLWGEISGYIALDPHATTVTGVTFFAPKETPGLGFEIVNDPFKDQWKGKKVVDASGKTRTIHVVKGSAATLCPGATDWCVDGVSGATITSRGVDVMVEKGLAWYDPYLQQLRGR